ncbi:MAG: GNAT family N-acetyltransferase [Actinopolymorphaceae bacterium]
MTDDDLGLRVLRTERLLLRRFTMDDVDALVELDGDPEVMRFLTGGKPTPRDEIRTEVLPYLLREYALHPGFGRWAAHEEATGEFVGWFGLRSAERIGPGCATLGYRLRRAAWGRGLATEGSRALLRKAFTELGVRRVSADTMAVNQRSRRVMERAGLVFVRGYHEYFPDPAPGTEYGEVEYAVTRDEWIVHLAKIRGG